MEKQIFGIIVGVLIAATAFAANPAPQVSRCSESDKVCRQFEKLAQAQQFEKIVDLYDVGTRYSNESRALIGEACMALASRPNVTPAQEEAYYRGALQVNHAIAYMGLYFIYVQKDEGKAMDFLREYIKTKPADTVPYAILGEIELNNKNYELADTYLRQAKKVAYAYSPRIDWMLFQANYLMKEYQTAKDMFGSAVTYGKFEKELRAMASDQRFDGIDMRPEFKKYQSMLRVAMASSQR